MKKLYFMKAKILLGITLGAFTIGAFFIFFNDNHRQFVPTNSISQMHNRKMAVNKPVHKPLKVSKTVETLSFEKKVHTVQPPKNNIKFHKTGVSTVTAVRDRRIDPLAGVWDPGRLQLRNPFMTVSGVVTQVIHEPSDADFHIDILPDPEFKHLLNGYNYSLQRGSLVVEVIPLDDGKVPIPHVGEHITAVGAYVLDTAHGWTEIHPAWLINGLGSPSYTETQLLHSETVISDSYDQLVHDAGITVMGQHLTTIPGGSASVTINTAPYAAATVVINYGKTSSSLTDYADEEGYITFNWGVPVSIAAGTYPIEIKAYIHKTMLNLNVLSSDTASLSNSTANSSFPNSKT